MLSVSCPVVDPIAEIRKKLGKYPNLKYESGHGFVVVHPTSEDGFTVRFDTVIGEHEKPYIVNYEGWPAHFADPHEALNCFAFDLSSEARFRVRARGGKAYKWTLEARENGEWRPHRNPRLYSDETPNGLAFQILTVSVACPNARVAFRG